MTDRIPRTEGALRNGLETWLDQELRNGRLEGLPSYHPPRGGGQRPEQFARLLLAGLKDVKLSGWERERLRDDGRAFRSWAEKYPTMLVPAS